MNTEKKESYKFMEEDLTLLDEASLIKTWQKIRDIMPGYSFEDFLRDEYPDQVKPKDEDKKEKKTPKTSKRSKASKRSKTSKMKFSNEKVT